MLIFLWIKFVFYILKLTFKTNSFIVDHVIFFFFFLGAILSNLQQYYIF